MSHTPVKSGLPSGRRGMGPEGDSTFAWCCTTGGATESDCARATVANAANTAIEIKQVWNWFFTWKPSQTGLDGAGSLRVLLYHCEIHAFPSRNFLRRRYSLRSKQRLAALRA